MGDPSPAPEVRRASCTCGQLHFDCTGDPVRVSVCHCLACQRRTGSVCGATVWWETPGTTPPFGSDHVAVAVGAFADPSFPEPTVSVYEERHHPWVALLDGPCVVHID